MPLCRTAASRPRASAPFLQSLRVVMPLLDSARATIRRRVDEGSTPKATGPAGFVWLTVDPAGFDWVCGVGGRVTFSRRPSWGATGTVPRIACLQCGAGAPGLVTFW